MKALTYHGTRDVRVETVPDPRIEFPDDIVLRVTAAAIGGSDLHVYRGKVPGTQIGDILGREFMGVVEETGVGVNRLARGDRVVVPFTIACGSCYFCDKQLYAACENTTSHRGPIATKKGPRPGAGTFGISHLYGGYPGGQAEYVRVPCANVGPLKLPAGLADEQVLFLSDSLPTGYQAVLNGGIGHGSTVAIHGAGPVGCMAAACARLLGAERIFMVDHHDYRLDFAARTWDVLPINFDDDDPVEVILQATSGRGADVSIDAIGFEAKGSALETVLTTLKVEASSGKALRQCIAATRRGGVVSVAGVYTGHIHGFMFGEAFDKGLTLRMGPTHVQRYMPKLLRLIENGQLKPEAIISHRMPLADAPRGYELFEQRREECRKVVLAP